jgi:hypothetical protein
MFNGQLTHNEIFNAIYNMIISQQVFADNIYETKSTLADMSRVDGTLYGDTKLYYDTDVLKSNPWGGDLEAPNLLALDRPADPECQAIYLDVFRQIRVTVDYYLSKRAWKDEGAFAQFNSVTLGWLRETKKVYDQTTYNTFIGVLFLTGGQSKCIFESEGGVMPNNQDIEQRKQEFVDAAEKLFKKNGIVDTTISAIVKEMDVAKGLFYYYLSLFFPRSCRRRSSLCLRREKVGRFIAEPMVTEAIIT